DKGWKYSSRGRNIHTYKNVCKEWCKIFLRRAKCPRNCYVMSRKQRPRGGGPREQIYSGTPDSLVSGASNEAEMARRTKEEALETRDRLLDAAAAVFCDKGVTNTSLCDISKAAGVTRGAFYWHFRNKT